MACSRVSMGMAADWRILFMHSKRYLEAKKEFVNCIVLSPVCLFISLFIAFQEWYPIMKEERAKENANA
jgi:hypothetical protein